MSSRVVETPAVRLVDMTVVIVGECDGIGMEVTPKNSTFNDAKSHSWRRCLSYMFTIKVVKIDLKLKCEMYHAEHFYFVKSAVILE